MKSMKVLVTGARGVLGASVLKKYAESGAKVYGADLAGDFKKVPGAEFIPVNLSDSKSVQSSLVGLDVDVLVHCAGGFRFGMTDQISDADIDFLINANLKSGLVLARELLPGMKKKNFGRMVFVSARATMAPGVGVGAYAASKAGLNMLVGSIAEETKDFDINVNAVLPTIIDTPINRSDMPGSDFSKWVKPEEISEIVYSLTSPWGKPIHGALIPVAGRL
jgi:NAD(P)-dependent dehydrogenase (short-subunit alcohol dehydrogenase family)